MKPHILRLMVGTMLLALLLSGATCGPRTPKYTLSIATEGRGATTPLSGAQYSKGTAVALATIASSGWVFSSWQGSDGAQVVGGRIVMDGAKDIKAVFRELVRRTNAKDGSMMVLIPAGPFIAGGLPAFSVPLPAYYMAEYEVTNAQYAAFLTDKRPDDMELAAWITLDDYCFVQRVGTGYGPCAGKAAHPVVQVSWFGAAAYAEWAGLRLPTELEWEKASRGTDGRAFPWGDRWDSSKCRNRDNRGSAKTSAVGSYPTGDSPFGMKDMAGNAAEWCADWFEHDAYARYQPGDLASPSAPSRAGRRVFRGGSWSYDDARYFGCADRGSNDPADRGSDLGFRCAGTP